MNKWLELIQFGLIPGTCILCSAATKRYQDLCLDCELDLPTIANPCWQCGLSVPAEQEICGVCLVKPPRFSHCFSAFEYAPPVDILISQFKNQHKIITGKVLAKVLAQNYLKSHLIFPDFWLPVPLHKSRLKIRGFNQALEIAEVLADLTQLPINSRICRRIKATEDQKSLTVTQRASNIKSAFTIDQKLDGESVGIVDDVVTTMATVNELSALLLKHGASDIQVVCLARTPAAYQTLQG